MTVFTLLENTGTGQRDTEKEEIIKEKYKNSGHACLLPAIILSSELSIVLKSS